jgi:hypothetical protein
VPTPCLRATDRARHHGAARHDRNRRDQSSPAIVHPASAPHQQLDLRTDRFRADWRWAQQLQHSHRPSDHRGSAHRRILGREHLHDRSSPGNRPRMSFEVGCLLPIGSQPELVLGSALHCPTTDDQLAPGLIPPLGLPHRCSTTRSADFPRRLPILMIAQPSLTDSCSSDQPFLPDPAPCGRHSDGQTPFPQTTNDRRPTSDQRHQPDRPTHSFAAALQLPTDQHSIHLPTTDPAEAHPPLRPARSSKQLTSRSANSQHPRRTPCSAHQRLGKIPLRPHDRAVEKTAPYGGP